MEKQNPEEHEPRYVVVRIDPRENIVDSSGHGEREGKTLGAKAGLLYLLNDMGPTGLGIDFKWGQPLTIDIAKRASVRARVITANSDILRSSED